LFFPTKALSFDQIGKILRIGEDFSIGGMGRNQTVFPVRIGKETIHCARWDRDVPYADQERIKRDVRVLITNPDAIHAKLLPHIETKTGSWKTVLRHLFVRSLPAIQRPAASAKSTVLEELVQDVQEMPPHYRFGLR